MEYSDLYKQTGMHCRFSPDGRYLSLAFQHRLVIRNAETIAVVEAFHTPYKAAPYINDVQWAPTSDLVLTLCLAENKVNVWSVEDKEWRFELQDEIAGIKAVRWAPDGRHLLVWSDFELRLTIWSLVSDQKVYIQYPRLTGKGVDFHPDGKLMAVAQRKDYRDYIGIYEAESWSLIKEFPVDTIDMQNISWSPDGHIICAWDTPGNFNVLIYNPMGVLKQRFVPEKEAAGLGAKSIAWSPSSQFLAIGGYDQRVWILNNLTWKPLAMLTHKAMLGKTNADVYIEEEVESTFSDLKHRLNMLKKQTVFKCESTPTSIRRNMGPDPGRPNPRVGVGFIEFNADGSLLCTRNDNMPNALWIWRVGSLELVAVVQTLGAVRSVHWSPVEPDVLAFCTESSTNLYLWKENQGCQTFDIPAARFNPLMLRWSQRGDALVVMDKDVFLVAFPTL